MAAISWCLHCSFYSINKPTSLHQCVCVVSWRSSTKPGTHTHTGHFWGHDTHSNQDDYISNPNPASKKQQVFYIRSCLLGVRRETGQDESKVERLLLVLWAKTERNSSMFVVSGGHPLGAYADFLPTSIRSLMLCVDMTATDLRALGMKLPELQCLHLEPWGDSGLVGLVPQLFPRLRTLRIR